MTIPAMAGLKLPVLPAIRIKSPYDYTSNGWIKTGLIPFYRRDKIHDYTSNGWIKTLGTQNYLVRRK